MTRDGGLRSKLLLRLERAKQHFAELDGDFKRYLDASPFDIFLNEDQALRVFTWRVKELQPAPVQWWEILVGDVLHNLRAALDHLACELVESNGNEVTRQTFFPISENAEVFSRDGKRHLAGASDEVMALLGEVRPYEGGNHLLYWLHRLNIHDKHGLAVGASATMEKITYPDFGDEARFHIRHAYDRTVFFRPLTDGTILARFQSDGAVDPEIMRRPLKAEFALVFWEPKIVKNRSVQGVLRELIGETEKTLELFIPHAERG